MFLFLDENSWNLRIKVLLWICKIMNLRSAFCECFIIFAYHLLFLHTSCQKSAALEHLWKTNIKDFGGKGLFYKLNKYLKTHFCSIFAAWKKYRMVTAKLHSRQTDKLPKHVPNLECFSSIDFKRDSSMKYTNASQPMNRWDRPSEWHRTSPWAWLHTWRWHMGSVYRYDLACWIQLMMIPMQWPDLCHLACGAPQGSRHLVAGTGGSIWLRVQNA